MISSARERKRFSIGDFLFTVISMSKGCAEPCHENSETSTDKLNDLGWLVKEGAILAISSDLLTEIKETCDKSQFTRHSELTIAVLTSAEKSGRLWIIDDLPVFVSEGIATDSFAVVSTVLIQIFEAENSNQWMEYLRLGKLQANGNTVRVEKLNNVSRSMFGNNTKIIKQGETWNGVRKLFEVPIIWSRRIILYDQYALKNSRASRLPNRGDISGLDRFLQCLVETRRENNLPPLDELTIISHPSVGRTDSEKKLMLKMDPNLDIDDIKYITPDEQIEAMKKISHQHALHDWVGDVKLLFTGSRSEGNRFIVFESDLGQQIFEFGTKGLASIDSENIGDPIEEQFTIKGPLEKQEWQPFQDKLNTFKEHVIESTI